MLVFVVVAFGFLLWIAFLLAVMVLSGVVWALSTLGLWILELMAPPEQKKVASVRRAPPPVQSRVSHPAQAPASSDIWPKWTPAHRRYADEELALWQEQFDALSYQK